MKDYTQAFRLDGKTALVTGGARGLGAEIAGAFVEVGARVLIADVLDKIGRATAARLAERAAAPCAAGAAKDSGAAKTLAAASPRAAFLHVDVTKETDWERALHTIVHEWGGLDVLVNSAGVETAALICDCAAEDFRRVLDINVTGTFLGMKHAVRAMSPGSTTGRGGSIVNIASIAAMVGTSGHAAYHSSKGGVRSLSMAAAIECAQMRLSIRVNSVYPGIVGTDMGRSFMNGFVTLKLVPDEATAEAAIKAAHPLGFGEPEDVACAVLYLASDAARWCTGTELVLDGGYTAA